MHVQARQLGWPRRARPPLATVALRRARSLLLMAALALLAVVWAAGPAAAHATLVSSSPSADQLVDQAPRELVLRFDEAVDVDLGGGLRVFAPDGRRVDRASNLRDGGVEVVTSIDSDQVGSYTVAWRVVSEDSHVLSGSFVFHVQQETGAVAITEPDSTTLDVLAWFARWWVVTAMVVLGGLAAFGWFVSRAGSLEPVVRRAVIALALVGLAGSVLRFAVQVSTASGRTLLRGTSLWFEAVESTRAGQIDAARIASFLALLVTACAWSHRRALPVAMLAALGVAFANAYGGHAWTVEDKALSLMSSVVHQGAVAVWVGGLVGLVLLLRTSTGAAAAARFSTIATWALAATVASTVGWYRSGLLDGLFTTGYGRTILGKIAAGVAMAGIGYRNRVRLAHFVERRRPFVREVRGEVVLASVALGLTAALVGMVPAGSAAQSGLFSANYDDAAGSVSVTVSPARAGANTMHLYFFDPTGQPRPVDVAEVTVAIGDVPARRIDLLPVTQGHFSSYGFSLPTPGSWKVTITMVSRGQVATSNFEVRVS